MTDDNLSPYECKRARQCPNWTRDTLLEISKVAKRTIIDFANGTRQPVSATKAALKSAFAQANVEFRGDDIVIPVINFRNGAKL